MKHSLFFYFFFLSSFVFGEETLVQIHWAEEFGKGGGTSIVLAFLSVIACTSFLERIVSTRSNLIIPSKLSRRLSASIKQRSRDAIKECIRSPKSLLGQCAFLVFTNHNKKISYEQNNQLVSELAGRKFAHHQSRLQALAVIAGLAPLLGLLGTMIGMIESFKLVSLYGDDGGAAILADSIAKALITTALGLIIAIPSLGAYHFFKFRLQKMMIEVEGAIDDLLQFLYFQK